MTPAERLRAAADTIERTANNATPGPWGENTGAPNRYGAVISHDAPCDDDEREGYGGALIGESMLSGNRAQVSLWDPPTARLAAMIFREEASFSENAKRSPNPRVTDLADAILARAEVSS